MEKKVKQSTFTWGNVLAIGVGTRILWSKRLQESCMSRKEMDGSRLSVLQWKGFWSQVNFEQRGQQKFEEKAKSYN